MTVVRKPNLESQKAQTGPQIPAPDMRICGFDIASAYD